MKYKSGQLTDGKYAVFAGSKYFTRTVTDTKDKADKQAFIESIRWHQWQIDKIMREMDNSGLFEYGENLHDYLA
jgi:hypothetical protein